MSFKEEMNSVLTSESLDGKVFQLISFVSSIPVDEITPDLQWKQALGEDRVGYFNEMISEALNSYFEVEATSDDVNLMNTPDDLINFINAKQ